MSQGRQTGKMRKPGNQENPGFLASWIPYGFPLRVFAPSLFNRWVQVQLLARVRNIYLESMANSEFRRRRAQDHEGKSISCNNSIETTKYTKYTKGNSSRYSLGTGITGPQFRSLFSDRPPTASQRIIPFVIVCFVYFVVHSTA